MAVGLSVLTGGTLFYASGGAQNESIEQRSSLLKGEIEMLNITLKFRLDRAADMRRRLEPITIRGESVIKNKREAAYPVEQEIKDLESTIAILRRQIAGVSEEIAGLDIVRDLDLGRPVRR